MSFTNLKLKFHHEDSDSDLDLSREDDATTQHSMNNSTESVNDSFTEGLYDRIEDFLDNEGLVFTKYSPVLRSRLVKTLIPLRKPSFLDLTPRNVNSAVLIQAENKDSDFETPGFAERRKRRILTQIRSHFQAGEVQSSN